MSKTTGLFTPTTRTCSICGGHIGASGPDHTECSKIKQEEHRDKLQKLRRKKLSGKSIDYLCKIDGG